MSCFGRRRRRTSESAACPSGARGATTSEGEAVGVSAQSVTERMLPAGCQRFSYAELAAATGNFAEERVVGEGGFGRVYKGHLPGGTTVAIKRLDRRGLQGDKEFNVEVAMLGRLRHPHIVRLLGVCTDADHRAAVFEYLARGSLRSALDKTDRPLPWPARLYIALGVARGLAHLHDAAEPPLLHRDLTTNNILIGDDGRARLADFGLARAIHLPEPTHPRNASSVVTGTFGYVAPEAVSRGLISDAVDRYAFGVVLLELISGQPPVVRSSGPGAQCLSDALCPILEDVERLQAHVDPVLLRDGVPTAQLAAIAELASACLQKDPGQRPRMSLAVDVLEATIAFHESPPRSAAASPASRPARPAPASVGGSSVLSLMDAEPLPSPETPVAVALPPWGDAYAAHPPASAGTRSGAAGGPHASPAGPSVGVGRGVSPAESAVRRVGVNQGTGPAETSARRSGLEWDDAGGDGGGPDVTAVRMRWVGDAEQRAVEVGLPNAGLVHQVGVSNPGLVQQRMAELGLGNPALARLGSSPGQAEDMETPLEAGLRFGVWSDAATVSPNLATAVRQSSGRQRGPSLLGAAPPAAPTPPAAWSSQASHQASTCPPHPLKESPYPLKEWQLPGPPSAPALPPSADGGYTGPPLRPAYAASPPGPPARAPLPGVSPRRANSGVSDSVASLPSGNPFSGPSTSGNPFADDDDNDGGVSRRGVPAGGLGLAGRTPAGGGGGNALAACPRPRLPALGSDRENGGVNCRSPGFGSATGAPASAGVCLKCLDAPRAWEAKPCGHLVACRACALILEATHAPCPVCHGRIKGLLCHPDLNATPVS